MRIITINLPKQYLDAIQVLNNLDVYPSRSEAIRVALEDFLKKEIKNYEDFDPNRFEKLMRGKHK